MFIKILYEIELFLIKFEHNFCRTFLKQYYILFYFLNLIIRKRHNKIVFLGWPDFSGNSMAIYKYLEKNRNYNLVWITQERFANSKTVKKYFFIYTFKAVIDLLTAGLVFNSNFSDIKYHKILGNKKQKYVNLWHGMPIKTILNMQLYSDMNIVEKKNIKDFINKKEVLACAPSEFWQCVLCACFLADREFVPITGQPRNDYIIQNNSKSGLNDICDTNKYDKIVLYAPTFCKHNDNCSQNDFRLIQIPDFDINLFNNYLKDNDILMIAKLHPIEEDAYKGFFDNYSNIKMLNRFDMQKLDIELDYILGCFDMLITDYSSVYIDYLLADKPILFLKQNYKEYNNKRGFIMGENYDFFCPGPMINNFDELKSSLTDELKNDNYRHKREKVLKLFHKYTDGKASERICKFLNI